MPKAKLPACRVQNPSCGACGSETTYDDEVFACTGCGLSYGNGEDHTPAAFLDEEASPCNQACDNFWHGPHKITPGEGYECTPCALPKGHENMHWTNCQPVSLETTP